MSISAKSLLTLAVAASLSASPVHGGDRAPDYTGTMRIGKSKNINTLYVHKGAMRLDAPVGRIGTASEYDAPGQRPRIRVSRDKTGEIFMFTVTAQKLARLADDSEWDDLGEERVLATWRCNVQQRRGSNDTSDRRCVTADGVNLAFRRDFEQLEMETFKRERVSAREVAPPIHLLDPKYWGLSKAAIARSTRDTSRDYEATFDHEGGLLTVRRSGDWISRVQTGPASSTTLVNEAAGILITITQSQYSALEIRFRRATKDRELWPFPPRPGSMRGKTVETIQGRSCRWQYRPIDIDAAELECRTDDGAIASVGFSGIGGERSSEPRSFVRKPVALASIMPDASYFTLARYDLR